MMRHLAATAALLAPMLGQAHEGHGLPGASHWHAGDVLLWVGVALAIGLWLARRGK